VKFTELNLPEEVLAGIREAGFTDLTPVQEQTIPLALQGQDVAAKAQTGTGKTAAFLVSLYTRLLGHSRPAGARPRALVVAPTRELVVQICEDARLLGSHCPFSVQPVFGGVDYDKQRTALQQGVDIVIATPGRLIDYIKQRAVSLRHVEVLVIDEADRMFDMGFISDLRYILRRLPEFDKRQTLLLSATLDMRVMELAYEFMNLPRKIEIAPEQVAAERVEQVLYHVSQKEKFPLLLGLLRQEPTTERVLLFVNTKVEAERLSARLNANALPAAVISGDIPQPKRLRLLRQFREGELRFLVATDVASRGIHVDAVTHVFNYDLPQDAEDYVHRIGRTARAGAAGKAISLADEETVYHLAEIEELLGHKIPSSLPEEADFVWDYRRPPAAPRRAQRDGGRGGKGRSGERRGRSGGKERGEQRPLSAASPAEAGAEPGRKRRRRRKKPAERSGGESFEKPETND